MTILQEKSLALLAEIPLLPVLSQNWKDVWTDDTYKKWQDRFVLMAQTIAAKLALLPRSYQSIMPPVQLEEKGME